MKKIFAILLVSILIFQNTLPVCAMTLKSVDMQQNKEIIELPPKTSFKISMQSTIDSKNSEKNSTIAATLLEDLIINKKIIAPKGSIVYGEIVKLRKNSQLICDGIIGIRFNEIATPDNKNIKLNSKDMIFATNATNKINIKPDAMIPCVIISVFLGALIQLSYAAITPIYILTGVPLDSDTLKLAIGGVLLVPHAIITDRGNGTNVVIQAGTPLEVVTI